PPSAMTTQRWGASAPVPRADARFPSARDAFDLGAAAAELVFQAFEAAIEMIDAVDHRLALGGQAGNDQRHRGAQVGGHDLGTLELGLAVDSGHLPVDAD